jgi:tRNA nucleotidyltransferase (CCA-adding enzyme)
MKRLKFSNQMIGEVTHLIENHLIGYNPKWTDAAVRRLIKRVGPDHIEDLMAFQKSRYPGPRKTKQQPGSSL